MVARYFSIPQLIDATESAGIITAVLSFFQHLHTGSIYHMQLPGKLLPYLLSQTATASVITMKKAILCHIHFISAVTPTMPEHRALFAPFICMIESSQPPETLSADVGDPATSDIMAATAAGTFSGFQAVCSGNMHIPAVTAAFPPGPAVFTFHFFYCHKFPETPACKVFCHRVLSWHCFPEYIHSPLQSHASDVWYLLLSHFHNHICTAIQHTCFPAHPVFSVPSDDQISDLPV